MRVQGVYYIFNDKTLTVIIEYRPLFRSVKIDITQFFLSSKKKLKPVRTLLYSLTFEKTARCEKSTFQPPVNIKEFGLRLKVFEIQQRLSKKLLCIAGGG